jgi:hypothetical protein
MAKDKQEARMRNFIGALKSVDLFKSKDGIPEQNLEIDKFIVKVSTVFVLDAKSAQDAYERVYDDLIPARIDGEENWNSEAEFLAVYDYNSGRWITDDKWRKNA